MLRQQHEQFLNIPKQTFSKDENSTSPSGIKKLGSLKFHVYVTDKV